MIAPIPFPAINLTGEKYQKPWVRYAGQNECPYIEYDVYLAIELAAKLIYYEFPDRPDRTLWLGSACPIRGNCSSCPRLRGNILNNCGGHPGNSHGARRSIDFNYYTTVGFDKSKGHWGNITQYAPVGYGVTRMWDGNKLIPGIFDAERNLRFSLHLKHILGIDPHVNYGVQNILKLEMDKFVRNSYERSQHNYRTSETAGTTWNHHTHVHMVLKHDSTWSYINLQNAMNIIYGRY